MFQKTGDMKIFSFFTYAYFYASDLSLVSYMFMKCRDAGLSLAHKAC